MPDLTFRSDVVARLRDNMGGDESIIEAMLVSSDKDQLIAEMMEIPKTEGRIRFLMKKRHGTPFEHNALKFYVEVPIFVIREWHRHRIGWSYNEQSGRYSELPPMFYVPPPQRPLVQVGKPGDYKYVPGDDTQQALVRTSIDIACRQAYECYQAMLDAGIAREVARMVLPVNIYTKMYATCNARSLMAFLSLRTEHEAYLKELGHDHLGDFELYQKVEGGAMFPSTPMWEIAYAAQLTENVFASLFPLTHKAFCDFGRVCP